ncbi:hypothetical protein F511_12092 [Dorcoceras hygrometricum]|uniref:Uncharacterized protein n=1 Tax=Dorcoceras hygrometricum TaxID=472368 RepID=A0A2Z7AGW3_9LAMI|nr:hypothetical protein F511_12092 [Dorcoceras hygrometricum]
MRPLQYLRSAATVPAFGRYSACVRRLQCLCAAATVPPCCRYSPRPEIRFLRQPALEVLTNSARTETPQRGGRNKSGEGAAAGGGDVRERSGRPREGG